MTNIPKKIQYFLISKVTKTLYFFIFLSFVGVTSSSAYPNCLLLDENERLSNRCLLGAFQGNLVDEKTKQIIVGRLLREGYLGGLEKPSFSGTISPEIYYSDNINGGNPNKKLILGDLQFDGDPELYAKKGMLIGANVIGSLRKTYGPGQYLSANASMSYGYAPEHNLSVTSKRLKVCSKNLIYGTTSVDLCASQNQFMQDITSSRNSSARLSFSRLSTSKYAAFNEATFSLLKLVTEDYTQNQLNLLMDSIHRNNLSTSIMLEVGQPLQNQLALKYGLSFSAASIVAGREYKLTMKSVYMDGGKILGIDRSDKTSAVAVSAKIDEVTTISIGFSNRNSSIDFFDKSYPTFSVTHSF